MTYTAVKKFAIKLPLKRRMQLANDLFQTIPPMRDISSVAEMEARLQEVESGKVKAISGEDFLTELDHLITSLRPKRRGQRG